MKEQISILRTTGSFVVAPNLRSQDGLPSLAVAMANHVAYPMYKNPGYIREASAIRLAPKLHLFRRPNREATQFVFGHQPVQFGAL